MDADALIAHLGLDPHPEGGWFRETWRHTPAEGGRGAGTSIYYLLREGERSHWHRVDATEVWHHYTGAALELARSDGVDVRRDLLGDRIDAGESPQLVVAPWEWQAARPLGAFTLVGCTVSPAFEMTGFELAPPGWSPG